MEIEIKLWKSRCVFDIIGVIRRSEGFMLEVWKSVLSEVEQVISREQYMTWFPETELISVDDGVVTVGAPNVFKVKQLEAKFSGVIKEALSHQDIEVKKLTYVVASSTKTKKPRMESEPIRVASMGIGSVGLNNTGRLSTGLNPRYTLDNFVLGSNNDLAVSVARNIVDNPGVKFNPFFLYGGPGLGKTHLVQAIGNALMEKNPKLKILYLPTSEFYSGFIKALAAKKADEYRQKFMKLDVLIIDDFQMIMNKDASQVEFFDIFNALYQANKHIIVTSDRLPDQIKSVDERLASRLTWAGAYDLQLPQFEDRCAILRSKAEFKGVEIEDEAIEYIAENIKSNIRALEGELEHILAMADIKNMTPLKVIKEGYAPVVANPRSKTVTAKQVVEKVAKHYGLTTKEMCGKSRVSHIKNARQVAMYILSKDLAMSTPKIATEVGVKDHTTVMHGVKKIEQDLKLNFNLRDEINSIKEKLYA